MYKTSDVKTENSVEIEIKHTIPNSCDYNIKNCVV